LALLRSCGRRERGGLDVFAIGQQTGFAYLEVTLLLIGLEHRQLICSALVDDGRAPQRRLWYLTRSALALPS
jgi:hypothetical protein